MSYDITKYTEKQHISYASPYLKLYQTNPILPEMRIYTVSTKKFIMSIVPEVTNYWPPCD